MSALVYVVTRGINYEGEDVIGVVSSVDAAQRLVDERARTRPADSWWVYPWTVDGEPGKPVEMWPQPSEDKQ